MATTTTSNPASQADKIQKHFSKKLLAHAEFNLQLSQFAVEGELPKNMGANTVRYFRRRMAKTSDIVKLSQGIPISTFTEVNMEHVDIVLDQFGEAAKITDIVTMTDLFNMLQQNIEAMGEDCALHSDEIIRNVIISDMLLSDNGHERFAGITPTADSTADFASLAAATASASKFTRLAALGCKTQLAHHTVRAPKISGKYVALITSINTHDLVQDDDWLEAAKYSNPKALYKGEIGELDGVRYIEHDNPFIEDDTYGTYAAGGAITSTMFLGRGAFGCPKLAGSKSPWKPQVIVNDKADKSDPLNQFITAGWKSYWNAAVLNTKFLCILRSKSTFA